MDVVHLQVCTSGVCRANAANRSISDAVLRDMTSGITKTATDAVVYSDFRHGIFNRRTIPEFIAALPPGAYRVAVTPDAVGPAGFVDQEDGDVVAHRVGQPARGAHELLALLVELAMAVGADDDLPQSGVEVHGLAFTRGSG